MFACSGVYIHNVTNLWFWWTTLFWAMDVMFVYSEMLAEGCERDGRTHIDECYVETVVKTTYKLCICVWEVYTTNINYVFVRWMLCENCYIHKLCVCVWEVYTTNINYVSVWEVYRTNSVKRRGWRLKGASPPLYKKFNLILVFLLKYLFETYIFFCKKSRITLQ